MTAILQIETATQVCSAAVAIDGKTVALKEASAQNIHAGSLTLFIEEAMEMASLKYADLDAVAVSKGPGSYTGLRIGVSTAKGLCFALDKPLIAVDTLKMMANGFLDQRECYDGLVCPMIDARRMEVYTTIYDPKLNVLSAVSAMVVDEHSFEEELRTSAITFIGDGAMKCMDTIIGENATFLDANFNSASNMSSISFEAYISKRFQDVAYFEPYYLKDFVLTQPKKKV